MVGDRFDQHASGDRSTQFGNVEGDVHFNQRGSRQIEAAFPHFVGVPDHITEFIGRTDELAVLADTLTGGGAGVVTQATTGMGGVGKTALAVEYCHSQRDRLDVVWWLSAAERTTVVQQYEAIAPMLGLSLDGYEGPARIAMVRNWFETTDRSWLLVFDNADDPDVLRELIPRAGSGQVLVTSRHRDWSSQGLEAIRLDVLGPSDAVELLCTKANRPVDAAGAAELVEYLGRLALAVEQAGAYCRATGVGFDQYREALDQRAREMHEQNPARIHRFSPNGDAEDVTLLTVWDASLEQAAVDSGLAIDLSRVISYLDPDHIPVSLLVEWGEEESLVGSGDQLAVLEAIAALDRFCLVDTNRDGDSGQIDSISVHRLVAEIARIHAADADEPTVWAATAIRILVGLQRRVDVADPEKWAFIDYLTPHIVASVRFANDLHVEHEQRASLEQVMARYLSASGDPWRAFDWAVNALDTRRQVLGEDHPATLTSKNNLAGVLWDQGDLDGARALYDEVVEAHKEVLGERHPDTLASKNNLAGLLQAQGDLDGARALYDEVVETRKEVLGERHPATLTSKNNLAGLLRAQGDLDGARALYDEVVETRKEVLGERHPDTLTSKNNLAGLLQAQGDLDGAPPQK